MNFMLHSALVVGALLSGVSVVQFVQTFLA